MFKDYNNWCIFMQLIMSRKRELSGASSANQPVKKRPTSIDFFCKPGPSVQKFTPHPSPVPKKPSPGSLQGLKLYSEEEIQHTSGYTKLYRQFWNRKVTEINDDPVSKRAANEDKVAARGAIDTAWAVEKAEVLKLDAHRLEMVINDKDITFSRKTLQSLMFRQMLTE